MRFVIALLLSSCSVKKVPLPKILSSGNKQIVISASSLLNDSTSIMIDIVQAIDQPSFEKISKMSSKEYFQNKEMLLQNQNMKLWNIQIVPNHHGYFSLAGYSKKSAGVILFAGYHRELGTSKVVLKKNSDLTKIQLGDNSIVSAFSAANIPVNYNFKKVTPRTNSI